MTNQTLDHLARVDELAAQLATLTPTTLTAGGQHLADLAREQALRMEVDLGRCGAAAVTVAAHGAPGTPAHPVAYGRALALSVVTLPLAHAVLEARGWQLTVAAVDPDDDQAAAWVVTAQEAPAGISTAGWQEAREKAVDGDEDEDDDA